MRRAAIVVAVLATVGPKLGKRECCCERDAMQIQINTDSNVAGTEAFADHVKEVVTSTLGHLSQRITRVEVHVSDQKGGEGGEGDKRCMMEARLQGRQPTAVTHQAVSLDEAIGGAAEKLKRSLESTLGRLSDARMS